LARLNIPQHITRSLEELQSRHHLRTIPEADSTRIDFCTNDYLGLRNWDDGLVGPMEGAGAARLLMGNLKAHLELESFCAAFFRAESCLLFNSGYQANVGLLSAIAAKGDTYLYDEACHASLKDGMRLSFASKFSFRHNDLHDLERLLKKTSGQRYIVLESLYSMDGDWCDLLAVTELARRHDALVILDEAHSTGLLGEGGSGFACSLGLESAIFLRIFTFGKAIGRMGAVVAGPNQVVQYLINKSRAWIYSTAMPGMLANSIINALRRVQEMDGERNYLRKLREQMEAGLGHLPAWAANAPSPIVPWLVPGNEAARSLAARLQSAGFEARAVLAPSVPAGKERIRFVLHAFNTTQQLDNLVRTLIAFEEKGEGA
jgi:8-amino-7-oxononanoate synthase